MKTLSFLLSVLFISVSARAQQQPRNFFLPSYPSLAVQSPTPGTAAEQNNDDIRMALDSMKNYYNSRLTEKEIYLYDSLGRLTERISLYYSDSTTVLNGFKVKFVFNERGKLAEKILSNFGPYDNDWQFYYKESYFYNQADLLDSIALFGYFEEVQMGFYLLEYDQNALPFQKTYYALENSSAMPQHRYQYAHDAERRLIRIIYQEYHYDENDWLNVGRESRVYNSEGLPTDIIFSIWYPPENEWRLSEKIINSFTPFRYPDTITLYEYIYNEEEWTPDVRNIYRYDSLHNLITRLEQRYTYNQWDSIHSHAFSYDNTYTYDQLLLPDLYEGNRYMDKYYVFNHKLDTITSFYNDDGNWLVWNKQIFYYSPRNLLESGNEAISVFRVYPNPFSDGFFIQHKKIFPVDAVYLTDLQGRIVQKWNGEREFYKAVKVRKGMYLLQIQSGTHRMSYRVMKR